MQEINCRAILFDLDGVLVDSTALVERHWSSWAAQHGLQSAVVLEHTHGMRTTDTLRAVASLASHLSLDIEQEATLIEEIATADIEGLIAVPGARELLLTLPERRWAVVTSGPRSLATRRLQVVGFPLPHVFITAEQVSQGKPHPEGYLKAARLLELDPRDCVVIEDAPAGIQAARAAGCSVIGVATTFAESELKAADFIVPDLSHIRLTSIENDVTSSSWLKLSIT